MDDTVFGVLVDLLGAVQGIIMLLQRVEVSLALLTDDRAAQPRHGSHLRLLPPPPQS